MAISKALARLSLLTREIRFAFTAPFWGSVELKCLDRSTTELRWITLWKRRVRIVAHDSLEATANALFGLRIGPYGVAATIL